MKKQISILSVLFIIGLLLVACQTPAATTAPDEKITAPDEKITVPDEKITVGLSLFTRTHTFYNMLEDAITIEAEKRGIELIIVDANLDDATQINQVQDFITQKVDAILMTPVSTTGVESAIELATEANIPVFTWDSSSEGGVIAHVATDNYAGGVLAGHYAGDLLDGKGEVTIIGCPSIGAVIDRDEGFREAMKDYPEITIVAPTGDCDCDAVKASNIAQDMLVSFPELDLIFGAGDPFALGALTSVTAVNADVNVIGFDGLPEGIAEVKKNGLFVATITQDTNAFAVTALDNITKYLNGEEVEPITLISPQVIDINNVE